MKIWSYRNQEFSLQLCPEALAPKINGMNPKRTRAFVKAPRADRFGPNPEEILKIFLLIKKVDPWGVSTFDDEI